MNKTLIVYAIDHAIAEPLRGYVTATVMVRPWFADMYDSLKRPVAALPMLIACTPMIDLFLACVFPELFDDQRGKWEIKKV